MYDGKGLRREGVELGTSDETTVGLEEGMSVGREDGLVLLIAEVRISTNMNS
jgi:hypothetical protein